jgi:hypothetical protein
VGKIVHHSIPLSRESLLKKQVNRILFSVVFLFFHHRGFLGRAREKIETQLAILGPCQGHALKNDQEHPALIPLIHILLEKNERRDITMKYT